MVGYIVARHSHDTDGYPTWSSGQSFPHGPKCMPCTARSPIQLKTNPPLRHSLCPTMCWPHSITKYPYWYTSCHTNLRCVPRLNITQSHREIIWLHSLHWSQTAQCSQMRSGSHLEVAPVRHVLPWAPTVLLLSCMKNIWSAFLVLSLVCSLCFVYLFKANVLSTPGCGVAPLIDRLGVHPHEVRGCNRDLFPGEYRSAEKYLQLHCTVPSHALPHVAPQIPCNSLKPFIFVPLSCFGKLEGEFKKKTIFHLPF